MRSALAAIESRLQHAGMISDLGDIPAVYFKPGVGDDENSGEHSGSPVRTIERGLELLLQQRNAVGRRPRASGSAAGQAQAPNTGGAPAAAAGPSRMPDRPGHSPVREHVEHVVDAATMLARAKHAEDDADPPRNSSPVERAHNSEFYEPRALSPPGSARRPRSSIASPQRYESTTPAGVKDSAGGSAASTGVGERLRQHRTAQQQQQQMMTSAANGGVGATKSAFRSSPASAAEEDAAGRRSPLKALKQQAAGTERRGRSSAREQDHAGKRLREIFSRADRNNDGTLTRAELILRLRSDTELAELLQLPARVGDGDRDAFESVFQRMDVDDSRGVDVEEFVRQVEQEWEEEEEKEEEDYDSDSSVLKPQIHRAAHRDSGAGRVITTYAEHSAMQEVPSSIQGEGGGGGGGGEEEEAAEADGYGYVVDEEEDEVDAATAFEERLAAAKERRSASQSPPGKPRPCPALVLRRG
jgi:hypothetical protein